MLPHREVSVKRKQITVNAKMPVAKRKIKISVCLLELLFSVAFEILEIKLSSAESSCGFVTTAITSKERLFVPDSRASPGFFDAGLLSPVIVAWSTSVSPLRT